MSESEQKKLNLGTKTPSNVPKLHDNPKTGTNHHSGVPKLSCSAQAGNVEEPSVRLMIYFR